MKILVINAHPKKESFCTAIVDKYTKGAAESNHEVQTLNLRDLELEKYLKFEYNEEIKLSKELLDVQEMILWADHLTFVYPLWWSAAPALLKVFFEVILQSGFAYKYQKIEGMAPKWDKFLKNKTANTIVTMDTPPFYFNLIMRDPNGKMMKEITSFVGIKLLKNYYFGSVKVSNEGKRKKWLDKSYQIGLKQ